MSQEQVVYVEGGSVEINGNSVDVAVRYTADDATLTGLGLRLHYDSSALTLADVSNILSSDAIDTDATPAFDSDDSDGNAATDTYIDFAWASLFGNWPGSVPADLFTATFNVAEGVESSVIGFSASSNAAGFDFIAGDVAVVAPPPPLVVTPNPTYLDENVEAGQAIGQAASILPDATFSLGGGSAPGFAGDLPDSTQQVAITSVTEGDQLEMVVGYRSDDGTLTGLGLRVHYDSNVLSLSDVTDQLTSDQIDGDFSAAADTDDLDGDAATDTYIDFAWASLFGNWPGEGEADLFTMIFDVAADASGSSSINFAASSNAAGFAFDGQTYTMMFGESPISVDAQTGVIKLDETADYETQNEYGFTVVATGSDGSSAQVSNVLHINDIDETAPSFATTPPSSHIYVEEAGRVIYTAQADDLDDAGAATSGVTYSLQNASADLAIDSATGEVSIVVGVSEAASSYGFYVVAADAAGNSVTQEVSPIDIQTDITAPAIGSPSAVAIDENSGAGQVVYTAAATDANAISWSLAEGSDSALSIDENTGAVTLSGNPDHETQSEYSFTVVATDAQGNASQQAVSLSINDLDELAPSITSGDTAPTIDEVHTNDEGSYASQVVYSAVASDDQADVYSETLTYSISDEHGGIFSIDASGNVSLDAVPNYENSALDLNVENAGTADEAKYFSFTVTAEDEAGNETEQAVKLYVQDVPEVAPAFTSSSSVTIEENFDNSQPMYTAVAVVDPLVIQMGGADTIAYSLHSDSDSVFSIDSVTGEVTISESPDYEQVTGYNFRVIATDSLGNYNDTLQVGVAVQNLDEIAPTITSGDVADDLNGDNEGQLDENSGAGQVVYTASADDSLDISAGVTFSLSGDSDAALSIHVNTGVVTLSDNPDHEAQSSYSFTVVASDGVNPNVTQSVSLDINDLDDTAAIVTSGDSADAIDENSGAGQVIYTATADDSADVSDGVTFSLAAGSDAALSINANTGAVTLATDPNHEAQDEYSFTVVATDAADNVSEGQSVTLNINDLDDTAPAITSAAVADAIDENSGAGQVVYTATADDSADVNDGTINFSLSDDSNGLFSINSATGAVTLSEDPNFEATEGYSFTVVATDGAGNATSQQVNLSVTNLDDTAPIVKGTEVPLTLSSFSGANQTVYAPVNDSSLVFETAYDNSSDVTSEPLTFEISFDADNAQYAGDFAIDAATGVVTYLPDPFTEQETESIFYTVTATDGQGNSDEGSAALLELKISGKEFNAPLFNYEFVTNESGERVLDAESQYILQPIPVEAGYQEAADADIIQNEGTEYEKFYDVVTAVSGSVDASIQSGDVIYTAVVADATPVKFSIADAVVVGENAGHNQEVYSAVSSGHLSIDENSGAVSINGVPWSEGAQEYSFIVTATDSSDNSSDQLVTLDVSDYAVAPQVADVSYSLAEGHDEALSITDAGLVVLLEDPNYEGQSVYNFVVEIADAEGNVREQAVTLNVGNIDDVAPTVTSSDAADAIDENTGAAQVVYTATADDSVDSSGNLTFSLAEGSDSALRIDAQSGVVTLLTDPDHEAQSEYSFTVLAADEAGNVSEGHAVTLSVNDLDEIRPVITSDNQVAIDENLGEDQVIYTASSHDAINMVERGPISIDFVQTDEGELTLKLFVEESLASEFTDGLQGIQFTLNYAAEEQGILDVSAVEYPATPWINEVNDQEEGSLGFVIAYMPPDLLEFMNADTDGLYNASGDQAIVEVAFKVGDASALTEFSVTDIGLTENGYGTSYPAGQAVYEYAVGDNGQTTYSLAEGSDSALLIDEQTGEVTLSGDADYENQSEYSFTVVATDASGNNSQESVTVSANNLDEVAPIVTSGDSAVSIKENSGAGQIVYRASADDGADISDGFTFGLSADSDSALSIDAETGVVTLSDDPDFEAQPDYSFTVIATDAAGNQSEGQSVTLSVNNLDEAAPEFTSGDSASVEENHGVGTVVYTAVANDSADISGGFKFGLSADSDPALAINPSTGKVSLLSRADYEEQSEYSFTVIAIDRAGHSSEQAVTLSVENLDEVAPIVTSEVKLSVSENVGANHIVYRASADDSADHSDGVVYSLSANSDSALSIDEATGVVTLAHNPDFESQDVYGFTVFATDMAGQVSKGHKVKLTVDNLDEVAPTITSTDSVFLSENSGVQQVIYTATADDSADISGGVTFSLAKGSDAGLEIDSESGEVTLVHAADYEAKSSYSFTVVATDEAENSSQQQVSVEVSSLTHVDVVHWNSGLGIADTNVAVDGESVGQTDKDGQLTVGLPVDDSVAVDKAISALDVKAIDVSDALAALRLAAGKYSSDDAYYQSLAADVDGNNAVTIFDALAILKHAAGMGDDIAEWRFEPNPQFVNDSDSYEFTGYLVGDVDGSWSQYRAREVSEVTINMDEGAQAGQKVFKYDARAMELVAIDQGLQSVGGRSGQIRLAEDLDYETKEQYSFTLLDKASGEQHVYTLQVGNVDEVRPDFVSATAVGVEHDIGEDQVIYTAVADDRGDAGKGVAYRLSEDSDSALSINVKTGDVTLTGNTDHNAKSEYYFTVIAEDGVTAEAQQQVVVSVLPEADKEPPVVTSDPTDSFNEDVVAGEVVYTATASEDATFSLARGSDKGVVIDAETGEVSLRRDANFEHQSEYNITIVATDVADNASEQAVTLTVNDLDEVAPKLDAPRGLVIEENSGAGQVLFTAEADDSADISEGVAFSLAGADADAFTIGAESGDVTLVDDPNYEQQSFYSFTVVATDAAGNASAQQVKVKVANIDDIAPDINSGDTAESIDENIRPGKVVYTATADDSADGSGKVTFSLAEGSDAALTISASTGRVRLTHSPDHEEQSEYSFTVVATDKAGSSSQQQVTLSVNDLDEVAPSITSGDSADSIDENSDAGQVIYTATADDSADTSGGVTLSLADGHDEALAMNSDTGEVFLLSNPDHESQSEYSFTIIATDAAGNASKQEVSLSINDLDEVAPVVTSGDSGSVVENSGAGQVVYTAQAKDSADISGGVTFSLAGADAALSINTESGEVTLAANPDHEAQSSYGFTVVATDAANNASEQSVTVSVVDVDESAPDVVSSAVAGSIDENSGYKQLIYTAAADDSADVSGGELTYGLAEGHDEALAMNSDTGEVFLLSNPDYEAQDDYSFTVIATDKAGHSSEQVVSLSINNLDEVAPTVTSGAQVAIDENSGADQVVYTAVADDSADISGDVTYSLAEGSDAAVSIDAESGEVTLADNPNYESQSEYNFAVVASDGIQETTKVVTLNVNNLDESGPVITSGSDGNAIDENTGAAQVVYTATADDSADTSGGVTFSLVGDHDGFAIDANTGVVTTTEEFTPDYEDQAEYGFIVLATDAAGHESAGQPVSVSINDLDDTLPVITSSDTALVVENSGAGQVIYNAVTDNNDGITFALTGDSDSGLSIDSSTGEVTLAVDPDFEAKSEYSFTVVVNDEAGNGASKEIALTVIDQDDTPPAPPSGAAPTAIDENSGAGQIIYTAEVDDEGVEFSLTADSDSALSIDSASGEVTLTPDPNYEAQSSYSFTVQATDTAGNVSFGDQQSLSINNVDEVAPTITSGESASIAENSGGDNVVYTASSTDDGDTSIGAVTYSLALTSDSALSIDANSGEVTLDADPNYEDQSAYNFTVIATDDAGNASEQIVTLSVDDLDEVAAVITSGAVAGAIDENDGAGQVIYTAIADDSADISGGVSFSLAEGSDAALSIDAATGAVTLADNADYEAQSSYSFTVVATDAAGNASQQAVSMSVNDLDETAATITSGDSAGSIDENSGADQVIYTATADDSADISDAVIFSLAEGSDSAISIDTESGEVTLNADPDYEAQSSYNFTVVATDTAGNASQQAVTLDINDLDENAPVVNSADSGAVNENSTVIYTADASDAGTVTYSLTAGSDAALSIDADSGEVSVAGGTDYEAQSEYVFAVIATDNSGNTAQQAVTVTINDLDEIAPQITSTDFVSVKEGSSSFAYTATADDSADVSSGVSYSLSDDNAGEFSVDSQTGAVTMTGEASLPGYNFTVVASDGVNSSQQTVEVGVEELVNGNAPSVVLAGDIEQRFTQNADGSITLQLVIAQAVAAEYSTGIESMDFTLGYTAGDIAGGQVTVENAPSNPMMNMVNEDVSGQAAVGQLYFPVAFDASSGSPIMEVTFDLAESVSSTSFTVSGVILDSDDRTNSEYQLSIAEHVGSEGSDTYALEGGMANVESGAGSDIFVATGDVDSSVLIDFESGADSIEMGQLLASVGYTAEGSVSQVSGDTPDIADLIAGNDGSLDNAFGAYLDDSSNILTLFVDNEASAGGVDMQSYEVTIGEGTTVEDEDLSVTLSAFIA